MATNPIEPNKGPVLNEEDYIAIADAVAQRMIRFASPVLTVTDATAYVGKGSDTSFYRWCEIHKIRPCSQGRYSRTKIDQALNKESKRRVAKRHSK